MGQNGPSIPYLCKRVAVPNGFTNAGQMPQWFHGNWGHLFDG